MAYKSQMASARLEKRRAEAAERRALRFKMNGYNSLSNRPKGRPEDYTYNGEKTVHDILHELESTLTSERQRHNRKSFVDKMVANIVSPEVREYWRQRIAKGGIKF